MIEYLLILKTAMQDTSEELDSIISEFGFTENFNEAGYIMPDGMMLDFSGKRDGGPRNTRTYDHREVSRAMPNRKFDSASDFMDAFMKDYGAIRMSFYGDYALFDFEQPATREQLKRITDFMRIKKPECIGISKPGSSDTEEFEPVIERNIIKYINSF